MAIDFKRFLKAIGIKNATDMSKNLVIQVADTATTGTTTTLVANQTTDVTIVLPTISGGILTDNNTLNINNLTTLPTNVVAVTNGTGDLTTSLTTATEIGFVAGVTSPIQTQINGKANVSLNNILPTASVDFNGQKLIDVADPTVAQDAATKAYVDANIFGGAVNSFLSNLSSPTAINQDLIFDNVAGSRVIQTEDSATTSEDLRIRTGNSASGGSGSLNLNTGTSSDGISDSGSLFAISGVVTGAGSTSGSVRLASGSADFLSGGVLIKSGNSTLTSGIVTITSGNSTSESSGDVNVNTGPVNASGFLPGAINIQPGDQQADSSTSAAVNITGGASTAAAGTIGGSVNIFGGPSSSNVGGGSVNITSGLSSSGNGSGAILIKSANESTTNSGGVTITSGDALNSSGGLNLNTGPGAQSGAVTISTALSTNTSGNIDIFTGEAQSNQSGTISLTTGIAFGNPGGVNDSGNIDLATGSGLDATGDITFTTGIAVTQSSGAIRLTTGNSTGSSTGNIELVTSTVGTSQGEISLDGRQVNVNSTKIVNVTDPTSAQDAATKNYVDTFTSPKVVARYYRSTDIPAFSSFPANSIVNFDTSTYDSNSAVTTGASWKFTAPGTIAVNTSFSINVMVSLASAATAQQSQLTLFKNGTAFAVMVGSIGDGPAFNTSLGGDAVIRLSATDFIDVRIAQSSPATSTLVGASLLTYIVITQLT